MFKYQYLRWFEIKRDYPAVAARILAEYKRVKGMMPFEKGNVYLMQGIGTDWYKIGKSNKPVRRLGEVSPKMPFPSRLVATFSTLFMTEAETLLHKKFDHLRTNGEWFELDIEEVHRIVRGDHRKLYYAYVIWFGENVLPWPDVAADDEEEVEKLKLTLSPAYNHERKQLHEAWKAKGNAYCDGDLYELFQPDYYPHLGLGMISEWFFDISQEMPQLVTPDDIAAELDTFDGSDKECSYTPVYELIDGVLVEVLPF